MIRSARFTYISITLVFLLLLILKEDVLTSGCTPIIIMISMLRELGVYHGFINEILLSAIVVGLTDIPLVVIFQMIDRLSYLFLDIAIASKKMKTKNPGNIVVLRSVVFIIVFVEKIFWIYNVLFNHVKLGSPSIYVRLMMINTFIGTMVIQSLILSSTKV